MEEIIKDIESEIKNMNDWDLKSLKEFFLLKENELYYHQINLDHLKNLLKQIRKAIQLKEIIKNNNEKTNKKHYEKTNKK